MTDWNLPPEEIEKRSFAIIDAEAPAHDWAADAWSIVRRMVHTSADFDWVGSVRIHPRAIRAGIEAIRGGRLIVTDTRMAQAGISMRRLRPYGVETECLIDHPETARLAVEGNMTRSAAAVDEILPRLAGGIFAAGNAPTAIFRLLERVAAGAAAPALVIGLPVGFVNAAEAKQALIDSSLVYISAVGRKGGSNVAAAVVNALAVLAGGSGDGPTPA